MSGPMILCMIEPVMVKHSEPSTFWTNTRVNAWRFGWIENSTHRMFSMYKTDLFIIRGSPEYIRSDNGPEFVAKSVRNWISAVGAKTAYIEPGNPWENGYCESFNARLRDEFLNGEIFYTIKEAKILIEQWRVHYNTVRPHSSLNWNPPAPESLLQFNEISMIN